MTQSVHITDCKFLKISLDGRGAQDRTRAMANLTVLRLYDTAHEGDGAERS